MNTTIIHISDLHFHTYPQYFRDWKSKRILGAANLLFRRKRQFPLRRAKRLVEQIQKMNWDHLVISGDQLNQILKAFGYDEKIAKKILIIGGGNIGFHLAKMLENEELKPNM